MSYGKFTLVFALLFLTTGAGVSIAQDEEDDPVWSAAAGARYLSRYTSYGVDLGNDLSAAGYSLGLDHASGFSLGVGAVQTLGSGGALQNWSLSAGYDWEATSWFTLSAEVSHYEYQSDSASILAPLKNSLSIGADADFGPVGFGVSYDTYLGTNPASYISLTISSFATVGPLTIVPLAQMTFMSQTIEDRLLKTSKKTTSGTGGGSGEGGGGSGATTTITTVTTLTGLSGISVHCVFIYPVFSGLSLTFVPSYLNSPKSELSTSSSQFLWSAGLRYSIDF